MIVSELIEILQKKNPNRVVMIACDGEGNGFSKLTKVWSGNYKDGEIGLEQLTDALRQLGYTEEDIIRGGIAVLVLYPDN